MSKKVINLEALVRTEFGKGAARRARRDGLIPAVLYGHGTDPQHLAFRDRAFAAVLRNHGVNAVLTLDIDGTEQIALTKSFVIHPITRNIQHVDLLVLKKGERVNVEINVVVEGEAAPGTLVYTESTVVEIDVDALEIPDQVEVSIEGLEAGSQILAGGVELPEGVTLVSDPDFLLVNVVEAPSEEDLEGEGDISEPASEPDEAEAE